MERLILIRYGEIFLKGKNRSFFENLLKDNIKNALGSLAGEVYKIPGRMIVSKYEKCNEHQIINILKSQAGIYSVSPAVMIDTDKEEIYKKAVELLAEDEGTFKVKVNRADKSFAPSSMEFARLVGGKILASIPSLKVDVKTPEHVLEIDIRENGKTMIFTKIIKCMGGMPVGSSGKGLLLLSGGIDSPVAGYMMAKRGTKLYALHFHSFPYTSELARLKVEELSKKIAMYNAGDLEVYMCSVTRLQEAINKYANEAYNVTLLRRGMFTVAERLSKELGFSMIITGESLGQVASQTIESMSVVSNVVKEIPIIRPLVAFDKQETIEIAKAIDTFDISIRPYEDCCTVFVPDNPVTKPRLYSVMKEEEKFDFKTIVDEAYSTIEKVIIKADR